MNRRVVIVSVILVLAAAGAEPVGADMRGEVVCGVPANEAVLITRQLDNGSWRIWTPVAGSAIPTHGTEQAALTIVARLNPSFVCEVTIRVNFREYTGRFYRLRLEMMSGAIAGESEDPRILIVGVPEGTVEGFRDCRSEMCPEMVVLPGGDLAMSRYEVTVGEFQAFAETVAKRWNCVGNKARSWQDPGFSQTERHPVVCVSWNDAQEYVTWLSRITGEIYRLPLEAEWDRGVAGSEAGCSMERMGVGTLATCPVGSSGANDVGLSDTAGNVWEWMEDCHEDDGDCDDPGAIWHFRVARGSYPHSDPPGAARRSLHEYARFRFVGIRVVREME